MFQFCLGMSVVCLFISFIAGNVSGYILLYFMILGIFFVPLGFKYLPEEYVACIKQMLKSLGTSKGTHLYEQQCYLFSSALPILTSLITEKKIVRRRQIALSTQYFLYFRGFSRRGIDSFHFQ